MVFKKQLKVFGKSLLSSNHFLYVTLRKVASGFLYLLEIFLRPTNQRLYRVAMIYRAVFTFSPDRMATQISPEFNDLKHHLIIAARAFFEIAFARGDLLKPCHFFKKMTDFSPDSFVPWKLLHYCYYYTQSWGELHKINGSYETIRAEILRATGIEGYDVILGDHVTGSIGHSQIFFFFKIQEWSGSRKLPKIGILPSTRDRMSIFYKAILPDLLIDEVVMAETGQSQPDLGNFIQDSFPFMLTKKYFDFYDGKGRAKFLGDWTASGADSFAINIAQARLLNQFLSSVGLKTNDWYVVLHVRQTADSQIRNCDIENYYGAIEAVTSHGGWVFRIGDTDMAPLSKDLENVVDMPFRLVDKPPFIDLYLLSTARFVIGTCSGPCDIPFFFNVPRLITNWPFMSELFGAGDDLCIPVSYHDNLSGKMYSLDQQLSSSNYDSEPWIRSQKNIVPIMNSSEEISCGVIQMIELTSSNSIRKCFPSPAINSLSRSYEGKFWFLGSITKLFLRNHPNYLS
jgi:putative glycosyltransferase (TIGR04372 family)